MEFTVRGNFSAGDKKTGTIKIVKRNVVTKISFPESDIYAWEEVVNTKGVVMKKSCRLYLTNDLKEIVVNKSYAEISKIKNNKTGVIGFYEGHSK